MMAETAEGQKKMEKHPSLYQQYAAKAGHRALRDEAPAKTTMRSYSPAEGKLKAAQVLAERAAKQAAKKA